MGATLAQGLPAGPQASSSAHVSAGVAAGAAGHEEPRAQQAALWRLQGAPQAGRAHTLRCSSGWRRDTRAHGGCTPARAQLVYSSKPGAALGTRQILEEPDLVSRHAARHGSSAPGRFVARREEARRSDYMCGCWCWSVGPRGVRGQGAGPAAGHADTVGRAQRRQRRHLRGGVRQGAGGQSEAVVAEAAAEARMRQAGVLWQPGAARDGGRMQAARLHVAAPSAAWP